MGRDGLLDARLDGLPLHHDEYHGAREVGTTAVQKHIVFFAGLDFHEVTVYEPVVQLADSRLRDRYQPLFRPLAHHAHETLGNEEVAQLQRDQLRDAQAAGEEHLDDGAVAVALPFRHVDGCLQRIDLFC